MQLVSKLVALALMALILGVPAFSVAACIPQQDAPATHCPPGCAMMEAPVRAAVEAVSTSPGCCSISSGNPAPSASMQAPPAPATADIPRAVVVDTIQPLAPQRATLASEPIPDVGCGQAQLCTFLN